MSLSPGTRLDRYEVRALLGSGGMGEVYRARDPKLARDVALKVLRTEAGLSTEGSARLFREARAVAALSHTNVLAVFDVGEVQEPESLRGLAYIAMELVVGRSLRSYLGDDTVPLEQRIGWLRDAARGLEAAHNAGIVHRDVKAENVMIRSDGVVKVLDFGIARRAAVSADPWSSTEGHSLPTPDPAHASVNLPMLTRQGAVVGTPFYMAPEQLRGEEPDARADQFGWAVMAYWLLAGEPPWTLGADTLSLVSQILSSSPRPPVERNPRVPAAVSSAILRALEKDRAARFPSMGALSDALDASLGAVAVAATASVGRAAASVPRGAGSIERAIGGRGLRFGAVIAAAIVVAGGAGAVAWRWRANGASSGRSTAPLASIGAPVECSSNADCVRAHGGAAWHCHSQRHACVEVASPDCTVHAEPHDAEAADVVWLGGLFPTSTDPALADEMRAADIARSDFASALGASAERTGALHARPIALVACDEGVDATRATRHLVDDVEVPAVLGFRSTSKALTTIPTVLLPAHVLSLITISQAPDLTRIPEPANEPRLVWRTTLDRLDYAAPLARFISDVLEPRARAEGKGAADRPMKVAAVWSKTTNHDVLDALFDTLHYNGKSALENGANFRQFVYDADGDAGAADVVSDLVTFAPQVIVFAEKTFPQRILAPLEAQWPSGASSSRPIYVTGSSLSPRIEEFVGRDPARRHRFFAVTSLSTTSTNAKLVLRYNVSFPSEPVTRTGSPSPSYDAFHVLAYATYALGDAPVTGPALSLAIDRLLPPGEKIDVGPAQILAGFEILRSGANIDLNGAIGALDFDPATGEAPIDYSIVCMGLDDRGNASRPVDSGLVYDARAKKLVGALRCP
jgi:hypothetical protein